VATVPSGLSLAPLTIIIIINLCIQALSPPYAIYIPSPCSPLITILTIPYQACCWFIPNINNEFLSFSLISSWARTITVSFIVWCVSGSINILGISLTTQTEWVEISWSIGNILGLYSEGAWFKSWLDNQLPWLRVFLVFLSPYRQITEYYLIQIIPTSFRILFNSSAVLSSNVIVSILKSTLNNSEKRRKDPEKGGN
jgi:hypothetical protein